MAQKLLHTKALVTKAKTETDGVIEAVVGSSNVIDRMGEVIDQDGWVLDNYKTNPVILWGHNVREDRPPIGKAIQVWVEGKQRKTKKLMFKVQFDLQDSFAAEIYRKVKDGFVNTVSVGFLPLEWDDNTYTKSELLELSFVPVPANPEALVQLRGLNPVKSLEELFPIKKEIPKEGEEEEVVEPETEETAEEVVEDKPAEEPVVEPTTEVEETDETHEEVEDKPEAKATEEKPAEEATTDDVELNADEEELADKIAEDAAEEESKSVIAYADHGVAPESEGWDGPGEVAKCKDVAALKAICAWFDSEDADNKGAYKLPHHLAESKKAVWRGVSAAMAALLGARGGVKIPDADRKGVYNHLAKHYKAFDKEVPDFKLVEDQVLAGLDEELLSLTLDREDKHVVRLIKKLIQIVKEQNDLLKSAQVPSKAKEDVGAKDGYTPEVIAALQVIDKALSL